MYFLPTPNLDKRHLSMSVRALLNQCRSILLSDIKRQIFLDVNWHYYGVNDVKTIRDGATWTQLLLKNFAQVTPSLNRLSMECFRASSAYSVTLVSGS